MQLFYNPDVTETTSEIYFSKDESRHITKVLRKNSGDQLQITNGQGWLFYAIISSADQKKCTALISEKFFQKPRQFKIHLAVAPTKMNERFEWFLEKATEIGVDIITPLFCEHSERRSIKEDRLEKIIQAAMKQSLHTYLPILEDAIAFPDFISKSFKGQKFIAHCEETAKLSLKNALETNKDVLILIGPEGDFSASEIKRALTLGYQPVTLGATRLRTETAAVVACHSINFQNE